MFPPQIGDMPEVLCTSCIRYQLTLGTPGLASLAARTVSYAVEMITFNCDISFTADLSLHFPGNAMVLFRDAF